MLRLLGRDEVEATLEEKGIISVTDDICNQEYRYGREIVDQLFPPDAPPSAKTIH